MPCLTLKARLWYDYASKTHKNSNSKGLCMYAVIEANGRHLKVKEGEILRLDRVAGETDAEIVFDRVLLAHDGKDLIVGSPLVERATVSAKIVRQSLAPKVMAFRYKPKKRVRTRHGHRQPITELRIEKISFG